VHSPFGATLMAIRDNRLRAMAIGIPVVSRLVLVYAVAAGVAGAAGALLAQTTVRLARCAGRPLGRRAADAGHRRRLYGGIVGAIVFKLLQDSLSAITPQYWMFWIGLLLVLLVLVGRERLLRPWTWFGRGRGKEPA
jgi:branched-chain amino acid transport system permease protein